MRTAQHRRASGSIAIGLASTLGLLAPAVRGQPACEARLRIEPQRAFVGEQVLYGLEIHRRDDVRSIHWARPLDAPGFRIESLPTRTNLPPAEPGGRTLGVEERRALFPTYPGELEIPPARLRCTVVSEGEEHDEDLAVPSARVRVLALPEAGRPAGFAGVVGRLSVRSWVEPAELVLGGSTSLTVLVEGRANLWELDTPFDPERPPVPDVDFLERPSELARDAAHALRLRRYFFYDLVPRTPGSFEVPAVSVPYFDPELASFAVATAHALRVVVRAAPPPPPAAPTTPDASAPDARDPGGRGVVVLGAGLLAGASGAALVLWARRHRRSDPRRAVQQLLARAEAERAEGEVTRSNASLARALRVALEGPLPGALSSSAEELLAAAARDPDLLRAATLLAQLDAARFSGGPDPEADPDAVRRAALRVCGGH